jgi:hypothetical protein
LSLPSALPNPPRNTKKSPVFTQLSPESTKGAYCLFFTLYGTIGKEITVERGK